MKNLISSALLLLALLLPTTAVAYDFEVDGIYYNINGNEATVASSPYSNKYSGDVIIPETVSYDSVTYTVTAIDDEAFWGCHQMTSITIPNSVVSIGNETFRECIGLRDVTIPSSVTSIGNGAFSWCRGLTSVTIPRTLTSIGINPFWGSSSITSITVENGNPNYDSRDNCNAIIETASNTLITGCLNTVIPDSITVISYFAFACCGVTSVDIPNTVTAIKYRAFYGCSHLLSVTIPNSVTFIGDLAFDDCSSLETLSIPNSVTTIGELAFWGCYGLKDVYSYIQDLDTVSIGERAFASYSGDYPSRRTLHVPHGTADAYQADENWYPYFGQIVDDLMPDLPGDVNIDGEVNIADVNAVLNIILGGNGNISAADVNDDGEVNIADVNAIIDIILGGVGDPDHIQVFNYIINSRAHRDGVVVFTQNTAKVIFNYTRNTIQITGSYKDIDDQMHSYSTSEMQMTNTSGTVYSFLATDDLGNGVTNLYGSIDVSIGVMKYVFQQDDYTIVCTSHLQFRHVVTTISNETGTSREYDRPQYVLMLDGNAETCTLMIMGFVLEVNGEEHESPVTYNNLEVTITDEGYIISADQASSNQGTSYDLTDVNIIIDGECEHISGSFKTKVSRHEFSGNLFE